MKISPIQHSQILGWALTGYGIYQGFGAWNIYWTSSLAGKITDHNGSLTQVAQAAFPQFISGIALCVISLIAGVVVREPNLDPKVIGLLFVFGALVSFPVGTMLSAYVLAYLFVIRTEEIGAPEE